MKRVLPIGLALLIALVWGGPRVAPEQVMCAAYAIERAAAGLERARVVVGGDTVTYLAGGRGEAPVLLHGFGADKDNWTRVARHLPPHFRVLAPDLPPFGESSAGPEARYRVEDQIERVRASVTFRWSNGRGRVPTR